MILSYIENSKTKESHYVASVLTTMQLMLPLRKRMEIIRIEEPFKWSRELVEKIQKDATGLYYSPSRKPSTTSEGENVSATQISWLELQQVADAFGGYFEYITDFIDDMKKVFPTLEDDWGIYVPEVKYLSPEPLVNYDDLSLIDYDNVHFVGDALSARGITVSGAQGIYVTETILGELEKELYLYNQGTGDIF